MTRHKRSAGRTVCDLRQYAQEMVQRSSLRAVARSIGLSAQGLKLFLSGALPRDPTLAKLRAWYFREQQQRAGAAEMSPDTARAVIHLLVEGLPAPKRARVVEAMLSILLDSHRRQGTPHPGWLDTLWREQTLRPFDGR